MPELVLDRVTKRFGQTPAVDSLDLTHHDGELLVMVGPSGSGKTTALRLVAGLETPTSGRVAIGGRDVTQLSPRNRNVAMVVQSFALYPHWSVERNLQFGLRMRRVAAAEVQRRVEEAAQWLRLEPLLRRMPSQLSGGEQQRVALARALVQRPDLFLLDEPLSNVDLRLRHDLRTLLKSLHQRLRATMLLVTHDQSEAMTLADRIVVIDAGRVQQIGQPLDLYHRPANRFVASFLGNPGMNLIEMTLRSVNGQCVTVETGDLRLPVPAASRATLAARNDRRVTVGIRAEDLGLERLAGDSPVVGDSQGWHGNATVVTVEQTQPLGDATLVNVVARGGHSLVVRLPGTAEVQSGEQRLLRATPERVCFFDPETGVLL